MFQNYAIFIAHDATILLIADLETALYEFLNHLHFYLCSSSCITQLFYSILVNQNCFSFSSKMYGSSNWRFSCWWRGLHHVTKWVIIFWRIGDVIMRGAPVPWGWKLKEFSITERLHRTVSGKVRVSSVALRCLNSSFSSPSLFELPDVERSSSSYSLHMGVPRF